MTINLLAVLSNILEMVLIYFEIFQIYKMYKNIKILTSTISKQK